MEKDNLELIGLIFVQLMLRDKAFQRRVFYALDKSRELMLPVELETLREWRQILRRERMLRLNLERFAFKRLGMTFCCWTRKAKRSRPRLKNRAGVFCTAQRHQGT